MAQRIHVQTVFTCFLPFFSSFVFPFFFPPVEVVKWPALLPHPLSLSWSSSKARGWGNGLFLGNFALPGFFVTYHIKLLVSYLAVKCIWTSLVKEGWSLASYSLCFFGGGKMGHWQLAIPRFPEWQILGCSLNAAQVSRMCREGWQGTRAGTGIKGDSVSSKMNGRAWGNRKEFMRAVEVSDLVSNLGTSYKNLWIHIFLIWLPLKAGKILHE